MEKTLPHEGIETCGGDAEKFKEMSGWRRPYPTRGLKPCKAASPRLRRRWLEKTLPREGIETLLPGLLPELDAVVDGITPARGRKPFSESFFYYNGVWL